MHATEMDALALRIEALRERTRESGDRLEQYERRSHRAAAASSELELHRLREQETELIPRMQALVCWRPTRTRLSRTHTVCPWCTRCCTCVHAHARFSPCITV